MGIAQGSEIALGWGAESTYGTAVAPTSWSKILNESLDFTPTDLVSEGLGYGSQFVRASARQIRSMRHASGGITFELPRTGFDLLFTNMLGTLTSTTWTVGDLSDTSLTVVKQLYDEAQSEIESFAYSGGKVNSWQLVVNVDAYPQLTLDFDFQNVVDQAAASPSYTEPSLWSFMDAELSKDAAGVDEILSVTLSGNNNLTSRKYLGNSGLQGEPTAAGWREFTGQLTYDFVSAATWWDEFDANTSFDVELEFLDTGNSEALTITATECFVTGEMPKVGGAGPVEQAVNFNVLYDGSTSPITVVYTAPV